ncbi:MAG: dTDP-glucose 4,6-dehydratase [Thermoanaerobaculia bacterium]
MTSILVTGGAGFIGSNFVRLAHRELDAPVVVLDKLTYAGNLDNLADLLEDGRVVFIQGDVAERETVRKVFADHRPRAVVNFAAESHVDRSIDDPRDFVATNVMGTFELLEAARRHLAGAPGAEAEAFRFVHVSTDEVYGSLGTEGLFSEETPYAPNSPYAATKAGADHLVRAYWKTYRLPALITNCSNNYGSYQFPEKLIPLMILNALEGRDLPVYGDGSNVRDWIYVEDHCRGVLRALEAGRPGEKYNLGGRSERTNLEIVELLCDLLDAERPAADNPALAARGARSYRDLVTFVADRPGHDRRYAIDDAKARRELGWSPRHDLESGLAATVRWYLEHQEWCERVQSGTYRRERLGLAGSGEEDAPGGPAPREAAGGAAGSGGA